jgi:hypothetical protein
LDARKLPENCKYEAAGRNTGITSIVHTTGILSESSSIYNTGTDTDKY